MSNKPEMLLWLSDSRGVYSYWDTWTDVCDNAVVTDERGNKYRVYQDGDCWLIPEGMEYNEDTDSFDYPEDRETEEED